MSSGTLRLITWVVAVIFGAVQVIVHPFEMKADGVYYLDMGDAIVHSNIDATSNAYWSPPYPLLLGIATQFAATEYEPVAARVVNLAAMMLAIVGFQLLWRELRAGAFCRGRCGRTTTIAPPATGRRSRLRCNGASDHRAAVAAERTVLVRRERATPSD